MVDDRSAFEEQQDPRESEKNKSRTRPMPYIREPEYQELLQRYQNGDLAGSATLIEKLIRKFPGDLDLLDFQREVVVKQSLQKTSEETEIAERRSNLVRLAIRGGIILAIVLVLGGGILWALNRYQTGLENAFLAQQESERIARLTAQFDKAEDLLKGSRYSEALAELMLISEDDPEFKTDEVNDLIEEAERELAIQAKYEQANQLYGDGELEEALSLFNEIIQEDTNYRDARLTVQKISDELEIRSLLDQIQLSYDSGNWQEVIDSYNRIISLDPSTELDELVEILIKSYIGRIREVAGQADSTVEDIEQAQEYYRAGKTLIVQYPEFRDLLEQLEEIADSLICNKFYLFATSLRVTGGFSPGNMREVLRLLERANSVCPGSPVVSSEIQRVELYVSGFEALLSDSLDTAINDLERLYQLEPDYADGLVQYLLFEAYMARGDALTAFADFENARADYELAETFARGKYGNELRIFWAEIQIGRMLRRLTLHEEAAEYFNFAFNLIDFDFRVRNSGDVALIENYEDAKVAMAVRDEWNAARLFEIVLEDIEVAYEYETIAVLDGETVFEVAFELGSTADVIRDYNQLGVATTFRSDQEIQVPYIEEFE